MPPHSDAPVADGAAARPRPLTFLSRSAVYVGARSMGKLRVASIAGALALALVAIGFAVRARARTDQPRWRTVPVARADLRASVTATGSLQPVVVSPVGAQVSGIVWKLHADFNSHVQAGQVLVELEPALFQNAVAQAEANLGSAKANVARARAQLADAVRNRQRSRTLADGRFLAQADADTAQTAVEAGRAALDAAGAAVLQAQAQVARAHLDLDHSVIHAPVTGTVISRNVDVGQAVASSFTAPTLFTIAEDLSKMYLHANVDEADIGQLHTGQQATFTVDTFRGRQFAGTVHQIRNAAQTLSNVVTYDVVMQVDNGDLQLRPGMTANVTIICASRKNVLAVPKGALRFRPPDELEPATRAPRAASRVYLAAGEQLRMVPVEVGISDGTLTEVSGLAEGDEVVVDLVRTRQPGASSPPGGGSGRGF
jgi:HlyD family secretion protein